MGKKVQEDGKIVEECIKFAGKINVTKSCKMVLYDIMHLLKCWNTKEEKGEMGILIICKNNDMLMGQI